MIRTVIIIQGISIIILAVVVIVIEIVLINEFRNRRR